jgi:hypothetical protein
MKPSQEHRHRRHQIGLRTYTSEFLKIDRDIQEKIQKSPIERTKVDSNGIKIPSATARRPAEDTDFRKQFTVESSYPLFFSVYSKDTAKDCKSILSITISLIDFREVAHSKGETRHGQVILPRDLSAINRPRPPQLPPNIPQPDPFRPGQGGEGWRGDEMRGGEMWRRDPREMAGKIRGFQTDDSRVKNK